MRCLLSAILVALLASATQAADPLPSWNEGPTKASIVDFVQRVTQEGSADLVPVEERVAVFDNDGTLWSEQPIYFQLAFALDRVKQLAPSHPEWREKEPFASILKGDPRAALAGGKQAILKLAAATHSGMTTDEFNQAVADWLVTARHPKTGRLYTEMTYQPMLELLAHLRTNGFKTYIVSGGGIDFLRVWSEKAYGIPPEQVVGSSVKTEYQLREGKPVILRLPEIGFIDDKAGKPIGIHEHIGRRPTMAFGNSDGDFQMLEWTTTGAGPRLGVLLHHTDAEREWAYDRDSHIGRLERGLDEAAERGWKVIDMKQDWRQVFPPQAE